MTKKTSIIVVISIVIILISLVISIYIPNREKIDNEIEDKSIIYETIEKDGKIGVINQNEEIVVEPKFDEIIIPNEHRAVFICEISGEKKVLNNKQEEIFKNYKNVEPIKLENLADNEYEKNVLIYEKDGKYGLLGITGKIITDAKYEEIYSLGYREGQIVVKDDNKYQLLDSSGNQVIKDVFDSIESDKYYDVNNGYKKSGYIVCKTTSDGYRYGYYDYDGVKVLDVEYNQIIRLIDTQNKDNIYLIASKNGQYGVFINGSKIVNTQYQSITYNSELGIFVVERTAQFGAINELGVEILKTEYSELQINGIYIYAKKEEEQKVFDKNGKEVDIPFTTIIESTSNSEYYIKNEPEGYSILNSKFEEISKQKYKYLEYAFDKYFIVTNQEDKSGIIDINENLIIDFKYDLIQVLKNTNVIQAINFETGISDIYNNELKLSLQISNANIEIFSEKIRICNDKEEVLLDINGNKIEE